MKPNPLRRATAPSLVRFSAPLRVPWPILFVLGSLWQVVSARAQNVLVAPPPVNVTPPALQEFRAAQSGEATPSETPLGLPLPALPLELGPVTVRPHVSYGLTYATGILYIPGHPESTVINQFSPGVLFDIGTHWALDYTPTWQWYSNNKFQDTLGHSLALNGWTTYEDWTLGLSQTYGIESVPLVQTGAQTEYQSLQTALSASYRFNSKVSGDFGLSQDFESAQALQSYRQWSTMDWVNYQFWPRFTAGLGLGAGYINVDTGANMTFQQFQGRVSWQATSKTSLLFYGGLEYLEFLSGGASPLLTPVFGTALQTQITKKTSLSLSASRALSASYFDNQIIEDTSVSINIGEQLTKKLSATVGAGYGNINYGSSAGAVASLGSSDYESASASLSYAIITRGNISATYQFSESVSSVPGLSFTANQVSLMFGYSF